MTISWDWIADNLDEIGAATLEHLQLTLIAVGVGFAISLLLGLAAYRWRRLYGPIAGVAGLLYTIPSLALFAVLVPFTGLTVLTAEIGLVTLHPPDPGPGRRLRARRRPPRRGGGGDGHGLHGAASDWPAWSCRSPCRSS